MMRLSGVALRGMRSLENALPSERWRSELGITALEYSLMGTLIAIALIFGLTYFGAQLNDAYGNIGETLEGIFFPN